MPIYEYVCPAGHVSERIVSYAERPERFACHHESHNAAWRPFARFVPSAPAFRINDLEHRVVMSDPKDIWQGVSGLDGTDGIDQGSYSSTSEMFDFGHIDTRRGRPEQEFPIQPGQDMPVKSIRRLEAGEDG